MQQLSPSFTSKVQDTPKKQKEPKNKGVLRAYIAGSFAAIPARLATKAAYNGLVNASNLSKGDSIEIAKAAQKGLKDTGLYDKGVRTFKYHMEENLKKDQKAINAIKQEYEISYGKLFKKVDKIFANDESFGKITKNALLENFVQNFKTSVVAGFLPNTNKIIIPEDALQASVFHEMGHALNANFSKTLKTLQKTRAVSAVVPLAVLLISLLNKRKTTDKTKETDSPIQKGADFVKRNAGKLTFLSFAPMLFEEGLASLRGQGIAKKFVQDGSLSKEIFKNVKRANAFGFATYAATAIGAVLVAKATVAIKDKIQAKYEEKQMNKTNAMDEMASHKAFLRGGGGCNYHQGRS